MIFQNRVQLWKIIKNWRKKTLFLVNLCHFKKSISRWKCFVFFCVDNNWNLKAEMISLCIRLSPINPKISFLLLQTLTLLLLVLLQTTRSFLATTRMSARSRVQNLRTGIIFTFIINPILFFREELKNFDVKFKITRILKFQISNFSLYGRNFSRLIVWDTWGFWKYFAELLYFYAGMKNIKNCYTVL